MREEMLISISERTTENFPEEARVKSITTPRKLPRDLVRLRFACTNDLPIKKSGQKFHWRLIRAQRAILN